MKRKILIFIANLILKRVLNNSNFQQKEKDIIFFINTLVDSMRDRKLDEAELTKIQDALVRLTGETGV